MDRLPEILRAYAGEFKEQERGSLSSILTIAANDLEKVARITAAINAAEAKVQERIENVFNGGMLDGQDAMRTNAENWTKFAIDRVRAEMEAKDG